MTSALSKLAAALRAISGQYPRERGLHVCVLCAFAFSQPLFAALTQQLVYLHDLEAGWFEIIWLLVMLTIVLPAAWILLDLLVAFGTVPLGGRGRNLVLIFLFWLVWLSLLRPFMQIEYLENIYSVWSASVVAATVAAILTAQLYLRSEWIRRWITVASIGIVCFPGIFLFQYGSQRAALLQSLSVAVERPVPVVMVVFDEFSGTTLMNRELQIDAPRFPQLSRLAAMSTWYRHASTVHVRTDMAMPALLSGQYPAVRRPPLEAEYPGNLFRVIAGTNAYDLTAFEPITRLCPRRARKRTAPPRSRFKKLTSLTRTMMAVYPRLILPKDVPIEFPPISHMWFGLAEGDSAEEPDVSGLYHIDPFQDRTRHLQNFLRSLQPSERPQFHFLHVELPHLPWYFLPSGAVYNFDEVNTFFPAGAWGEIKEDWGSEPSIIIRNEHRYLRQLQFVDRFVGQLLDRLQEIDQLDKCLLIVTADHGVSFRPGHSRRVPDAENLSDLLSVPLFIKLPGQTDPQVNDSNVESVDVLPTIAQVLGIVLTEPVDGQPISNTTRRPRKMLYFNDQMTIVEPMIPGLKSAVDRRWAIFGTESLEHPPQAAGTHPDWHGRPIQEFSIVDKPLKNLSLEPIRANTFESDVESLPCLIRGTFEPRELQGRADLVLAVNGMIVDSGPAFPKGRGLQGFEFLLPESVVRQHPCRAELFHVEGSVPGTPRLRRLGAWEQSEDR